MKMKRRLVVLACVVLLTTALVIQYLYMRNNPVRKASAADNAQNLRRLSNMSPNDVVAVRDKSGRRWHLVSKDEYRRREAAIGGQVKDVLLKVPVDNKSQSSRNASTPDNRSQSPVMDGVRGQSAMTNGGRGQSTTTSSRGQTPAPANQDDDEAYLYYNENADYAEAKAQQKNEYADRKNIETRIRDREREWKISREKEGIRNEPHVVKASNKQKHDEYLYGYVVPEEKLSVREEEDKVLNFHEKVPPKLSLEGRKASADGQSHIFEADKPNSKSRKTLSDLRDDFNLKPGRHKKENNYDNGNTLIDNNIYYAQEEVNPSVGDIENFIHKNKHTYIVHNPTGEGKIVTSVPESQRTIRTTKATEKRSQRLKVNNGRKKTPGFQTGLSSNNAANDAALVRGQLSFIYDQDHVHNCVTGAVIGQVPTDLNLQVNEISERSWLEGEGVREDEVNRTRSFREVFNSRAWGHDWDPTYKGVNASGMGATLHWTQELIALLHNAVNQIKVILGVDRVSILDVPCGDMAWMSRFLMTRDDIDYTGIDIVQELIKNHRKTFSDQKRWIFRSLDILAHDIPGQYDLIVNRMMLQHLYHGDVLRLLHKFSHSHSRFLLTTTFSSHSHNKELSLKDNPGRFRPLNLELPPVSLSPPVCLSRDGPSNAIEGWDHFMGLWSLPLYYVTDCHTPIPMNYKGSPNKIYSCTKWSTVA